jgi:4,5-DOPA dioxygenase extradiol
MHAEQSSDTERMPVLFVGHGSPWNAIDDNAFTRMLENLGLEIPRPKAILCVSAHWLTEGTWVTGMESPRTIHDFYGFPEELFLIRYPSPGSPEVARRVSSLIVAPQITIDRDRWGLDHGTWAVLRRMYPDARIPVLQLSLSIADPPEYHFELGRKLRKLREEGVLMIGSGNIVHNLRRIRWEEDAAPYDWAVEFDEWVKEKLTRGDHLALMKEATQTEAGKLSIPTAEHYLPLIYALGAADSRDKLRFDYEGFQNGSISMRCLSFRP